jgi:GT2 family glycosyltransferase
VGTILGYLSFAMVGGVLLALLPGQRAFGAVERVALAFSLGVGAIVLQIVLYGLVGLTWTVPTLALPWLLLVAGIAFTRWRTAMQALHSAWAARTSIRVPQHRIASISTPFDLLLWIGIASAVAIAWVAAATHVLGVAGGEDAFQQYLLKAKDFYLSGGFAHVLGNHTLSWFANLDHPPLVSLAVLWLYITGGGVNELAGLLLSPTLYTCLLCVFFALVRRRASRRIALGLTLLLAFAPPVSNLVAMGAFTPDYADMPVALFMLMGAGYTFLAVGQRNQSNQLTYFIVSGLALGFAALTKNEGELFLVVSVLAGAGLWLFGSVRARAQTRDLLISEGLAGAIACSWILVRRVYGISVGLVGHSPWARGAGAIAYTAVSFLEHAVLYWNVSLLVLAVGLVLEYRVQRRSSTAYLLALLIGQCLADIVGLLVSPLEIHYQVQSTTGRLLLQLTPLLLYLIHHVIVNDAALREVGEPQIAHADASAEQAPHEQGTDREYDQSLVTRGIQSRALGISARKEVVEGPAGETLAASVVLPTHGRRASLLRVLRALGRQSVPMGTFEVVAICDGDVDGSVAACRELAATLPYPLRVIEQVNQGPAAARNRGVMEARAPLIVFLDDDVVPDEALIATHMAAQHGQERLVTIGPLLPPADFHLNAWAAWEERALRQQYDAMSAGRWRATYRQFYTGNAAVLRRNILDAGAFDRRYRRAEDVEFALRLRDHGLAFAFLPEARGWHYVQRSFTSWQQMAMAYGQADVAMSEDGFREVLAIVTEEFPRRNRVVRTVTHLCVGRPALTKTMLKALGVLVQLGDKLRIASINYALCSVIFNLSYYSGLAGALGGRDAFERLVLNPRSGHGPHKAP